MATDNGTNGLDRRQFLRRAAVAGAAAAWTAPVVKTLTGTPAFAESVAGSPKDLSYIAVRYTDAAGQAYIVKWDLPDGSGLAACEGSVNLQTPQCPFNLSGALPGDCSLFLPVVGGQTVTVCFTDVAKAAGYTFVGGAGVGKCGNPQNPSSGGECVPGMPSLDGSCMTFDMCGLSSALLATPTPTATASPSPTSEASTEALPSEAPTTDPTLEASTTDATLPTSSTSITP